MLGDGCETARARQTPSTHPSLSLSPRLSSSSISSTLTWLLLLLLVKSLLAFSFCAWTRRNWEEKVGREERDDFFFFFFFFRGCRKGVPPFWRVEAYYGEVWWMWWMVVDFLSFFLSFLRAFFFFFRLSTSSKRGLEIRFRGYEYKDWGELC